MRQSLVRPRAPNRLWSMDFGFDSSAEGQIPECLPSVFDATHDAIAIEVERAISGLGSKRVCDHPGLTRGLPQVIRTDNGKEFCGRAVTTRAYERGVQRPLIPLGKPRSGTLYVESFNGCQRDECLDEHGFTHLPYARTVIDTWRREYREERPERALGGLTPSVCAKRLASTSLHS